MQEKELIEKIKELPPDKIAEVVNFVDFLAHRDDRALVEAASKTSEPAFARAWDNPADAEYDNL
ncbi:MAG: toxin-antitoxin system, antitoxin component, Xre family protein [Acidobacteria bacterium]|nr:MAG: toxin-antitoxin system, antitoxin component, Xre family protein [Acidobacteriota bacterium]